MPTYWQRLLRLPPDGASGYGGGGAGSALAAGGTLLAHDFHHSFARVLPLGHEARIYAFEALLFCAVDSAARCAPVSGFAVLLVWLSLRAARAHWGRNNLSRKTLVDKHFLI